jgi:intein/homing endonuclease
VEVVFEDGYTVKCTPDHLFKTIRGWKSAQDLEKGSQILCGSIQSPSFLTDIAIGSEEKNDILQEIEAIFIEEYGKMLLDQSLRDVIYIIEMGIDQITISKISSAFQYETIYQWNGKGINLERFPRKNVEKELQNGINLSREDFGIKGTLKKQEIGKSGKDQSALVSFADLTLWLSTAMEGIAKNTAASYVKVNIVQSVKETDTISDVWCLTVPYGENFCLANGSVVHNCADAFRTLATGLSVVAPPAKGHFGTLGNPKQLF